MEEQTAIIEGRRLSRVVLSMLMVLILLLSVIAALLAPKSLSKTYMGICVIMGLSVLVLQIVHRASGPKPVNWLTVDILFMFSFCVLHFWVPILFVLGVVSDGNEIWHNHRVVCYCTMMSVSGLAAFGLGFNFLAERYGHIHWPEYFDVSCLKRWKSIGYALFLGGLAVSIGYVFIVGEALTEGTYTGVLGGLLEKRTLLLLSVLLFTALALLTLSAAQLTGKWKIGLLPKLGLMVFLAQALIMGDRSLAVKMGVLVAAAYAEQVKHFSFKKLIAIIAIGVFLMGVVRITRRAPERTLTSFVKTVREDPEAVRWDQGLSNWGASVNTLYVAVDTVPEQFDYFYGKLKLSGIVGTIPFAQQLLPKRIEYLESDQFLTYVIAGPFSPKGYGTTIIADIYVDFGYIGVIVVIFGLGLLCKYIQQRARATASLTWGVAHACLIPYIVLVSRYPITGIIRAIIWPVLIIYIIGKILQIPRNASMTFDPAYWQSEAELAQSDSAYPP